MGGIERNISNLLRTLPTVLSDDELIVFGRAAPSSQQPGPGMAPHASRGPIRSLLGNIKRMAIDRWGLSRALRASGADLLHSPSMLIPRNIRVPAITHLYDLWLFDGFATKKRGWMKYYERSTALAAVRRATLLVVPTDAVAAQVRERFDVPPDRLRVIYPLLTEFPKPASLPDMLVPKLSKGFFLVVTTLEPRKNLERLLDAHQIAFRQCGLPLVIVGQYGWRQRETVRRAERSKHVLWLSFVDDVTLAGLYAGATAVVQLSLDEGFSYPVAEAMQFGAPLVLSDIAVHREVGGALARYVSPVHCEDAADGMVRVAQWSVEERSAYAKRTRTRVEEIRRRGSVSLYLDSYRELLGSGQE